jgi:hypothetical protein
MANEKPSTFTPAGALTGTEVVPLLRPGTEVRTTTQAIANLALGGAVTGDGSKLKYIPDGFINIADYVTLVGDGVTDNSAAFNTFRSLLPNFYPTFSATVTLTIASPCVVTLVSHGLGADSRVIFATTGALPTGITAGTVYFVLSTGLTLNTFRFSTQDPTLDWNSGAGEGPAVNTSGSQSGTQSIQVVGTNWTNVLLPPGNYHSGAAGTPFITDANAKKTKLSAYGATLDFANFSTHALTTYTQSYGNGITGYIHTVSPGSNTITLVTLGDYTKFRINGYVLIMALDLQGAGYPPNNHYFEYAKISAINSGTGIITLNKNLRNGYKSTYPLYYAGSSSLLTSGGPAVAFQLCETWDVEYEVWGLLVTDPSQTLVSARSSHFVDCNFSGAGATPTVSQSVVFERCTWGDQQGDVQGPEIDKSIEYIKFLDCTTPYVQSESSSTFRMVIEGCKLNNLYGTAKNTQIISSDVGQIDVGPQYYGASETLLIENSRVGKIQEGLRLDDPFFNAVGNNRVSNWSFTAGVLKANKTTGVPSGAIPWAVPGRSMYINDMAGLYPSMGSFTILDVYEDGTYTYIDTSLTILPVGNSVIKNPVTITIASPAVVSWASHGLSSGMSVIFDTTGTLPTGIVAGYPYFVSFTGNTTNTFQLSILNVAYPSLNTSGSQSGTQRAEANALHFKPVGCPRVTVINCTGCAQIVDLSNSPDDAPMFSYAARRYIGWLDTTAFGSPVPAYVEGNLVSMTVNVIRAYTGVAATQVFTITANGFDASLLPHNLSQIVNTKIVGLRTITVAAATGGQSGDTIAAYTGWIAGPVTVVPTVNQSYETLDLQPIVELVIQTDQATTKSMVIEFAGIGYSDPIILADTTTPAT